MTPEQITAARVSLGLTVAQFAGALGVSRHAVYRWQRAVDDPQGRAPCEETLERIRWLAKR